MEKIPKETKARYVSYAEIRVGEKAQFEVAVTENLIEEFARVSGDESPLHMDDAYAQKTPFKERIGHGMLFGLWCSRLVGMHLPGASALYLSQTLAFRKPLRIHTTVLIVGEIMQKTDATRTVQLHISATDKKSGELLADGDALVQLLALP